MLRVWSLLAVFITAAPGGNVPQAVARCGAKLPDTVVVEKTEEKTLQSKCKPP